MNPTELIRSLRGSHDWRDALDEVAGQVRDEPAVALDLAEHLDRDLAERGPDMAVWSARCFLLDSVAQLDGPEATRIAVRLAARPPAPASGPGATLDGRRGRNAMQLAGTRPAPQLVESLRTDAYLTTEDPGFGLLLAHELVMRGAHLDGAGDRYARNVPVGAEWLGHLPLALLPVERDLPRWLPRYANSRATAISSPDPAPADRGSARFQDLWPGFGPAVPIDGERVARPFADWITGSNGRVSISAHERSDRFATAGPGEPSPRPATPATAIGAAEGLERLFSAAVGGGAYTRGRAGSEARSRMWESAAGILGAPWPADLEDLAAAVAGASWIRLDPTDEPWFELVAWDVWMAVATRDRIVLIAATDAD